ncbi:MAG TPA: response regulator, partial [Syntrophales bacterium]|nr:response regulator [Syntrophales bacterium]
MSPAKNILVVDDDNNLLELIKMRLESASYAVDTALDEDDALEKAKNQIFHISIVDLQLERTNGIDLMEKLHLINPDMPVIILTAHGSIESAVTAIQKGAYSYLTKPFDAPELLLQIEKALEKQNLSSEIKRLKGLLHE